MLKFALARNDPNAFKKSLIYKELPFQAGRLSTKNYRNFYLIFS